MCFESRPGCLVRVCVADVNAESCLHELDKRCDCVAGSAARAGERAVSMGVGRDDSTGRLFPAQKCWVGIGEGAC